MDDFDIVSFLFLDGNVPCARSYDVQYNLNGSNSDRSFTVDDSNPFFQSLQNSSNSSRKQTFRNYFLILSNVRIS